MLLLTCSEVVQVEVNYRTLLRHQQRVSLVNLGFIHLLATRNLEVTIIKNALDALLAMQGIIKQE
jgi:hypothetical protein